MQAWKSKQHHIELAVSDDRYDFLSETQSIALEVPGAGNFQEVAWEQLSIRSRTQTLVLNMRQGFHFGKQCCPLTGLW